MSLKISKGLTTVFFVFTALFILITSFIYFFQHKLIFFPEVLLPNHSFSFDHTFEELNYKTTEGVQINALHFKAPEPRGIVYFHHGNAGSLRSWGLIADVFLDLGYDILIYDYRGFGKSQGRISEEHMYHDAQFIYDELKKQYSENDIVVYGRSIGTGVATKIAADNNPGRLVLESPYYNLPDLAKKIFSVYSKNIDSIPFGQCQ